jgi:xylose dehydrogenase (NAD/NADP)
VTVRWGLLSTARINDALVAGVQESSSGEIVAVASRDSGRARSYADARGIARAHGDYDSLLTDPDVDAVYVSLPNGMHMEWTERALRAGKHVLCEKPLTRDPAAAQAAFALAQERGLVLREAFMYRHHPQTLRLAELVAEGAIGPLRAIHSSFSFVLSDPGDVRLSTNLDGGALMDLGCYCVSATRLLAGEPEAVAAVQVLGPGGVDVSFAGALRFAGGVVAHFDASFQTAERNFLEVAGDTGTLRVADPWHIRAPGIELRDAQGMQRIEVESANSYRLEADDLADLIGGGAGTPGAKLAEDDAVGQARTLRALYDAAV